MLIKISGFRRLTNSITRALEIKPDDGYIIDSLGWVYYRQGKYDLALKTLRRRLR